MTKHKNEGNTLPSYIVNAASGNKPHTSNSSYEFGHEFSKNI